MSRHGSSPALPPRIAVERSYDIIDSMAASTDLPLASDPELPMPTPRRESYVEGLRETKDAWGTEDDDE